MVLLIKLIHQIDIKCLGNFLVSLSLGICVFTTQKNGQRNIIHQILSITNFFPFHSEMNEKKRENIRGSCCTKEKKNQQHFRNLSFLVGKIIIINTMQKKKRGEWACKKEAMTVTKGNMIMFSDLMNTSHNADFWDGTTGRAAVHQTGCLKMSV